MSREGQGSGDPIGSDPTGMQTYLRVALSRGRPTGPCECSECDCALHTYEHDETCVWCRHGQHSGEEPRPTDADPEA